MSRPHPTVDKAVDHELAAEGSILHSNKFITLPIEEVGIEHPEIEEIAENTLQYHSDGPEESDFITLNQPRYTNVDEYWLSAPDVLGDWDKAITQVEKFEQMDLSLSGGMTDFFSLKASGRKPHPNKGADHGDRAPSSGLGRTRHVAAKTDNIKAAVGSLIALDVNYTRTDIAAALGGKRAGVPKVRERDAFELI